MPRFALPHIEEPKPGSDAPAAGRPRAPQPGRCTSCRVPVPTVRAVLPQRRPGPHRDIGQPADDCKRARVSVTFKGRSRATLVGLLPSPGVLRNGSQRGPARAAFKEPGHDGKAALPGPRLKQGEPVPDSAPLITFDSSGLVVRGFRSQHRGCVCDPRMGSCGVRWRHVLVVLAPRWCGHLVSGPRVHRCSVCP